MPTDESPPWEEQSTSTPEPSAARSPGEAALMWLQRGPLRLLSEWPSVGFFVGVALFWIGDNLPGGSWFLTLPKWGVMLLGVAVALLGIWELLAQAESSEETTGPEPETRTEDDLF